VRRDHRRWPLKHSVDDLGVVDPAEIDRCNREVGVPELALDDQQRDALARHLDGMSVAELVRREPPSLLGCEPALPAARVRSSVAMQRLS
jgi:hypothetical protein